MGAIDFYHQKKGDDPSKIYERLVEKARRKYGTDPYNGKINQCNGICQRKSNPLPLERAREFANDDVTNNDKYGPAFCVPFHVGTKQQVDEIDDRLGALTEEAAREQMIQRAENKVSKVKGAAMSASVQSLEQTDSGTLPELHRKRPSASDRERKEVWVVEAKTRPDTARLPNNGFGDSSPTGDHETESKARSAIKAFYRKFPDSNGRFVIRRRWTDEIEHFARAGEKPSSRPMWEGTVKVVQTNVSSGTDGYIFYGMAPY